jgi:hypothetical protein
MCPAVLLLLLRRVGQLLRGVRVRRRAVRFVKVREVAYPSDASMNTGARKKLCKLLRFPVLRENSIQSFSTQCNIVTSDRLANAASLSSSSKAFAPASILARDKASTTAFHSGYFENRFRSALT